MATTTTSPPSTTIPTRIKYCYVCGKLDKENDDVSLFQAPKDKLEVWQSLIPGLTKNSKICERHFDPSNIIKGTMILDVFHPFQRWKLKKNTIPIHLLEITGQSVRPNGASHRAAASQKNTVNENLNVGAVLEVPCEPLSTANRHQAAEHGYNKTAEDPADSRGQGRKGRNSVQPCLKCIKKDEKIARLRKKIGMLNQRHNRFTQKANEMLETFSSFRKDMFKFERQMDVHIKRLSGPRKKKGGKGNNNNNNKTSTTTTPPPTEPTSSSSPRGPGTDEAEVTLVHLSDEDCSSTVFEVTLSNTQES